MNGDAISSSGKVVIKVVLDMAPFAQVTGGNSSGVGTAPVVKHPAITAAPTSPSPHSSESYRQRRMLPTNNNNHASLHNPPTSISSSNSRPNSRYIKLRVDDHSLAQAIKDNTSVVGGVGVGGDKRDDGSSSSLAMTGRREKLGHDERGEAARQRRALVNMCISAFDSKRKQHAKGLNKVRLEEGKQLSLLSMLDEEAKKSEANLLLQAHQMLEIRTILATPLAESLVMLEICRCRLESLKPILHLKGLRLANLSQNTISEVTVGITALQSLQLIDLSFNKLSALTCVDNLCQLRGLISLNLSSNLITAASHPKTIGDQSNDTASDGYRSFILSKYPHVMVIDDVCVSDIERLSIYYQRETYRPLLRYSNLKFRNIRIYSSLFAFKPCGTRFASTDQIVDLKVKFLKQFVRSVSASTILQRGLRRLHYKKKYRHMVTKLTTLQGCIRGFLHRKMLLREMLRIVKDMGYSEMNDGLRVKLNPDLVDVNIRLDVEKELRFASLIKKTLIRIVRNRRIHKYVRRIQRFMKRCVLSSRVVQFGVGNQKDSLSHLIFMVGLMKKVGSEGNTGIKLNVRDLPTIYDQLRRSKFSFFHQLASEFEDFRRFSKKDDILRVFNPRHEDRRDFFSRFYFPAAKNKNNSNALGKVDLHDPKLGLCSEASRRDLSNVKRRLLIPFTQSPRQLKAKLAQRPKPKLHRRASTNLKAVGFTSACHFDFNRLPPGRAYSFILFLQIKKIPFWYDVEAVKFASAVLIQARWRGAAKRISTTRLLLNRLLSMRGATCLQRWFRAVVGLRRRFRLLDVISQRCKALRSTILYVDPWLFFMFTKINSLAPLSASYMLYPEFKSLPTIDPNSGLVALSPISTLGEVEAKVLNRPLTGREAGLGSSTVEDTKVPPPERGNQSPPKSVTIRLPASPKVAPDTAMIADVGFSSAAALADDRKSNSGYVLRVGTGNHFFWKPTVRWHFNNYNSNYNAKSDSNNDEFSDDVVDDDNPSNATIKSRDASLFLLRSLLTEGKVAMSIAHFDLPLAKPSSEMRANRDLSFRKLNMIALTFNSVQEAQIRLAMFYLCTLDPSTGHGFFLFSEADVLETIPKRAPVILHTIDRYRSILARATHRGRSLSQEEHELFKYPPQNSPIECFVTLAPTVSLLQSIPIDINDIIRFRYMLAKLEGGHTGIDSFDSIVQDYINVIASSSDVIVNLSNEASLRGRSMLEYAADIRTRNETSAIVHDMRDVKSIGVVPGNALDTSVCDDRDPPQHRAGSPVGLRIGTAPNPSRQYKSQNHDHSPNNIGTERPYLDLGGVEGWSTQSFLTGIPLSGRCQSSRSERGDPASTSAQSSQPMTNLLINSTMSATADKKTAAVVVEQQASDFYFVAPSLTMQSENSKILDWQRIMELNPNFLFSGSMAREFGCSDAQIQPKGMTYRSHFAKQFPVPNAKTDATNVGGRSDSKSKSKAEPLLDGQVRMVMEDGTVQVVTLNTTKAQLLLVQAIKDRPKSSYNEPSIDPIVEIEIKKQRELAGKKELVKEAKKEEKRAQELHQERLRAHAHATRGKDRKDCDELLRDLINVDVAERIEKANQFKSVKIDESVLNFRKNNIKFSKQCESSFNNVMRQVDSRYMKDLKQKELLAQQNKRSKGTRSALNDNSTEEDMTALPAEKMAFLVTDSLMSNELPTKVVAGVDMADMSSFLDESRSTFPNTSRDKDGGDTSTVPPRASTAYARYHSIFSSTSAASKPLTLASPLPSSQPNSFANPNPIHNPNSNLNPNTRRPMSGGTKYGVGLKPNPACNPGKGSNSGNALVDDANLNINSVNKS